MWIAITFPSIRTPQEYFFNIWLAASQCKAPTSNECLHAYIFIKAHTLIAWQWHWRVHELIPMCYLYIFMIICLFFFCSIAIVVLRVHSFCWRFLSSLEAHRIKIKHCSPAINGYSISYLWLQLKEKKRTILNRNDARLRKLDKEGTW